MKEAAVVFFRCIIFLRTTLNILVWFISHLWQNLFEIGESRIKQEHLNKLVILFSGGITLCILTIKRRLWSLIIRLSWGSVKRKRRWGVWKGFISELFIHYFMRFILTQWAQDYQLLAKITECCFVGQITEYILIKKSKSYEQQSKAWTKTKRFHWRHEHISFTSKTEVNYKSQSTVEAMNSSYCGGVIEQLARYTTRYQESDLHLAFYSS